MASGSLPSALLRLVIARGCEQKGQGARKRERDYVCVCVGRSGLKGRERYLKKLEEGGSRYGEKGTRRPSKYATS